MYYHILHPSATSLHFTYTYTLSTKFSTIGNPLGFDFPANDFDRTQSRNSGLSWFRLLLNSEHAN